MEDVTVRLTASAMDDLGKLQRVTELRRTDLINRAIHIYAAIVEAVEVDHADLILRKPRGRSLIIPNDGLRSDS